MLRLMAVNRRTTGLLLVVAVLVGGSLAVRLAQDRGAFGCAYRDREHVGVLSLAGKPPHIRVRIGEGVRLAVPEGVLRDVQVVGDAGLAPGTQNGVSPNPEYVFRVTRTGDATVSGIAAGRRLSGTITSHC